MVPRTFLGALVVSITASPIVALFEAFEVQKFWTQYIGEEHIMFYFISRCGLFIHSYLSLVRLILTGYVVLAWTKLRRTLQQQLGFEVAIWYTLITVSQFHLMFYMSRPLPNVFALPLGKIYNDNDYFFVNTLLMLIFLLTVLLAINYWLQRNTLLFITLSGAATVIFRADVALLLGLFLIYDLYYKRTTVYE